MYRLLFVLLVIIITTASAAMYAKGDIGLVLFSFGDYQFQTTLLAFGATCIGALMVFLLLWRVYTHTYKLFSHFGSRRKQHLTEKARQSLTQGLIDLAEGRFAKAEKILLQHVGQSDNILLVYLAAARAAQQQGAHDRRDEYLRQAYNSTPTADIAISLTKAELQLAHNQLEQALATLDHLYESSPNHGYVLSLLVKTYQRLSDWEKLSGLLPSLKKQNITSPEEFLNIEMATWCGLLDDRAGTDLETLSSLWNKAPHHLKALPDIVEHYASLLAQINAHDEAKIILRKYLAKNWQESTIKLYSELELNVNNKQLDTAESWLNSHQHDTHLLLALGKMCESLQLWGKARNYYEASISVAPMPETHLKLALLLEKHMQEPELAQENYRLGLQLLGGHSNDKPADEKLETIAEDTTEGNTEDDKQAPEKPSLTII